MITAKIREVDDCVDAQAQQRVFEGHPEVSFACMNGGVLRDSKHSPSGREFRVGLLEKHFPDVRHTLSAHRLFKADGDIIDAFGCLWTARRIVSTQARSFPKQPVYDERGLRMAIVA